MPSLPRLAPIVLMAAMVATSPAAAVNLVPNDSFELYANCPAGYSNMFDVAVWTAPTTGTSDFHHSCANNPPFAPDVPTNPLGFQFARTGEAYCGFIPSSAAPDYREYIEAPLTSTLVIGTTYLVTFYVSLADDSMISIDRIGAYFSNGSVGPVGNYAALPYTPQVESPAGTFLDDTVNWMLVSGSFVANGTETHIVIGSFRDDGAQNTQPASGTWPGGAYYYIDDVSVEPQVAVDQPCCIAGACSMALPGECAAAGGVTIAAPDCEPSPCGATVATKTTWGRLKTIYR